MATVQLSDIIDIPIFQDLPAVNSPEKTALFESGVIASNPLLNQLAGQAGKTAELPFWNDLDQTVAPNLSTDDPTDVATPQKVVQGEQIARKAFLNQGWSKSDLASEIASGPKAMDHIRSRTDKYWSRQFQRRLLSSASGILADNIANDSGDMVIDVASESIAGQSASTLFSRTNFISTAFTLGDMFEDTGSIAVHSNVYQQMITQGDVEDVRDSDGTLVFRTYMGRRIIVDDTMTITAGTTDGFKYTTILFGNGAFGYGEGTPDVPVEIEREASQGEGGGIETLWTRKTWLLHPFGFATGTAPAATSYTQAELASAASWNRVVERKNVPLAFLVTN